MNVISATQLARAAKLTEEIESLNGKLSEAQEVVNGLTGQINPLTKELDGIMGYKAAKSAGGTGRFTDEQRAKISAGLTASWARKKQAALEAKTAADALAGLAPANA